MNKTILFYGAIVIALLSLCSLLLLRVVPANKVWDEYTVLYVDINTGVQQVRSALSDYNIEGVLYPDHAPFPLPSALAPVQYQIFESGFTYEQLQTSFFYDKDNNYNLYYIPQNDTRLAKEALKNVSFTWGIDSQTSIPALPFIITLLLNVVLFYYSKNKVYFLAIQAPFTLYTLVSPFFHIAASVCFLGLSVFIIQKYWNRMFFRESLLKNITVLLSFASLVIGSIIVGVMGVVLFLFTTLLVISLLYIVFHVKRKLYLNSSFQPILIHTAKTVRTHTIHNAKYIVIVLVAIVLLTGFALFNIQPTKKSTKKPLHIPAPSGYTVTDSFSLQSYEKVIQEQDTERLPDFTDFVSTYWHLDTYPYKRLNNIKSNIVLPGEIIEHTTYVKDGVKLEEKTEVIARFNDEYVQSVLDSALTTNNSGAEKLLASQGGFSRVKYLQGGTLQQPKGSTIFLFFTCAFILYVFIVQRVKRR